MDDREAIASMKRGDIGGLAALVERYQLRAVRTAYLITQDRALAEDVVQATFLRAYERIESFDSTRPFAPWFLRSVANAAIQAARKQERQVSLGTEEDDAKTAAWLLDGAPGPAEQLEQDELEAAVRAALDRLSPEQRATVVLRYYLGLNEAEIADTLDCPRGTVKWRLHTAHKRLRVLVDMLMNGHTQAWQED